MLGPRNRCEYCGKTGESWALVAHWGKWACPGCASRPRAERMDAVERRKMLLEKLEAEPGDEKIARLAKDVRKSIEGMDG